MLLKFISWLNYQYNFLISTPDDDSFNNIPFNNLPVCRGTEQRCGCVVPTQSYDLICVAILELILKFSSGDTVQEDRAWGCSQGNNITSCPFVGSIGFALLFSIGALLGVNAEKLINGIVFQFR